MILLSSANVSVVLQESMLDKLDKLDKLETQVAGVTPGANAPRKPGSSWLFHVSASSTAQLGRILLHLVIIVQKCIAVAALASM